MTKAQLIGEIENYIHGKITVKELLTAVDLFESASNNGKPDVRGPLPPAQIIWPDIEATKKLYRKEYSPDCTGRDEDVIEWTLNNVKFRRQ